MKFLKLLQFPALLGLAFFLLGSPVYGDLMSSAADFPEDDIPASLNDDWSGSGQQSYTLMVNDKPDRFMYRWKWSYSGKFNYNSERWFSTFSAQASSLGWDHWYADSLNMSTFPREGNNSLDLFGHLRGYLGLGEDQSAGQGFPEYADKYSIMGPILHRPTPFVVNIPAGSDTLDFSGRFVAFRKALRADNVFYTGQLYYDSTSISEATYDKSSKFGELVLAAPAMIVEAADHSWNWCSKLNVNRWDNLKVYYPSSGGAPRIDIPDTFQREDLDLSVPIPKKFSGQVYVTFTGFVARYTITKFTTDEASDDKFGNHHTVWHRIEEGGLVMLPMTCVNGDLKAIRFKLVGDVGVDTTLLTGFKGRVPLDFNIKEVKP